MIMMVSFAIFGCFCSVRSITGIKMIMIIIIMSLCVSYIYYSKFGSMFALMWVLVYLGGMMVCFVYVSFLATVDSCFFQSLKNLTEFNSYIVVYLLIIMISKALFIGSPNLYKLQSIKSGGSNMLFSETYLQIVSQSSLFFFITTIVLLYSLLQVLSMLNLKNKSSGYYLL